MNVVDWWTATAHPVVAPILLAIVAGGWAFCRRALRTLRAIDDHVLPHFRPTGGQEDTTLPARVRKVETAVTDLDRDLRTHMADEARQRGQDVTELRQSIGRVHDRIDDLGSREPAQ